MSGKPALEGNLFIFGDHINTDLIIPTAYLSNSEEEMGKHCMKDVDPTFAARAKQGDMVAGGINFGCGSTKNASGALKGAGITCVIAKSFGRIFFRNAINAGLVVIECAPLVEQSRAGDRIRVDFDAGQILNLTTGKQYDMPVYPPLIKRMIDAGGIVPLVKEIGLDNLWKTFLLEG